MDYNKQAEAFLNATATTLEVVEATTQKRPLWAKEGEKHGINYTVTLSNQKHKYTFDFWNSIHNAEIINAIKSYQKHTFLQTAEDYAREDLFKKNNISRSVITNKESNERILESLKPNAYDILACLSPLYEDTLGEFCDAYGYDQDSRTAEKTFEACKEQDRNLRKLFTHEELEQLSEIQ